MTIEPYQAVTVHLPIPMPPKPLSETYRDKLIARFGRIPSMAELAKLESATHRLSLELYRPQTALDKSLDARREQSRQTVAMLVAALTKPMTNQDIATATGVPLSTVAHMMLRALDEGSVKRTRVQRVYIWELADAPAYVAPVRAPKPKRVKPEPKPKGNIVCVRGVTFESQEACARHFGVSRHVVYEAIAAGKPDRIGAPRSDSKPITMEGLTFASLRACARHFKVSEASIRRAIQRGPEGKPDMIGSRKRK